MRRLSLRRPWVALAGLVTLVAVVALTVVPAALNSSQKHRLSASVVVDTRGPVPSDGQAWMTIHVSNGNDFVNVAGQMRSRESLLNAFVVSSLDLSVAVDGVRHPEWDSHLVPPPDTQPGLAFAGRWISTVTCGGVTPCTVVGHPAVVPGEDAVVFYYGWGHAPYAPYNEPNGDYVFTYTLHGTVNGEPVNLVATSKKIEMVGASVPKPDKVCVVVDQNGVGDGGFNDLTAKGATEAAKKLHLEVAIPDASTEADVVANIDAFVGSGDCDLIIGADWLAGALMEPSVATHPEQRFAVVDYSYGAGYPNAAELTFKSDQAGFLAGYVAAGTTASGKVGTYGGIQIAPVTDFMNGYALGVGHYNAQHRTAVKVLGWDVATQTGMFAGSFDDPVAGHALTDELVGLGADTVFAVAGTGTGRGSLEAAAAWKATGNSVRVIGVDTDWFALAGDPDAVILTSALKAVDVAVAAEIQALVDGTWHGGLVVEDLANNGVDIAPFHKLNNQVPGSLKNELKAVRAGIIDGTIPTLP